METISRNQIAKYRTKKPALNLWLHPLKLMALSVICHRELIMTLALKRSYMGTFSSI